MWSPRNAIASEGIPGSQPPLFVTGHPPVTALQWNSRLCDGEHYLAYVRGAFQILVGECGIGERKNATDDGPDGVFCREQRPDLLKQTFSYQPLEFGRPRAHM